MPRITRPQSLPSCKRGSTGWCVRCCPGSSSGPINCCCGWRRRSYATNGLAVPTRDAAPPAAKAGWSHHLEPVVVVLNPWLEYLKYGFLSGFSATGFSSHPFSYKMGSLQPPCGQPENTLDQPAAATWPGPRGAGLPNLIAAGRWKRSRMPARYTERQADGRGAVARYYPGERGLMLLQAA